MNEEAPSRVDINLRTPKIITQITTLCYVHNMYSDFLISLNLLCWYEKNRESCQSVTASTQIVVRLISNNLLL